MTTFKGNKVILLGNVVTLNEKAPDFRVLDKDLTPVTLATFQDKIKVISVVPSIDTGVCDFQTRKFNEALSNMENVVAITISCDLPFALRRWCGNAGLENAVTLSDHFDTSFGLAFGVLIKELRLLNRAVFILDKDNTIVYKEVLEENVNHPDYDVAIKVVESLR